MPEDKFQENPSLILKVVDYYADPGDQRSLEELAKSLEMDPSTLRRLTQKYADKIWSQVDKERKKYIPYLRSKGYKTLESQLKKSPKALELLMKITGDLVERVEQTNKYETIEQKKERLGELLNKYGIKLTIDNTASVPVSPSVSNNPEKSNDIKE